MMLDKVLQFIKDILSKVLGSNIWSKPLGEFEILDIAVVLLILFLGYKLIKYVGKVSADGFKKSNNYLNKKRISARAKRTVCPHCGKTVDKCDCPDRRRFSNRKKLRLIKKEKKVNRRK